MNKKTQIGLILGFALSSIILFSLLRELQWSVFFQELSHMKFRYLPLLVVLFAASFWVRAVRWRLLLPTGLEVSTMKLYSACILGMLASCVLPLRAGEFVRPWVLSRSKQVSFSMSFSSVVTERVFDVLAMLTLFGLGLHEIANPPAWAALCAKGLACLAAVILTVMIVAYFQAGLVLNWTQRIISFIFRDHALHLQQKIISMASEFVSGLKGISSLQELLQIIFWSYVLWGEFSLIYWLGLLSFDSPAALIPAGGTLPGFGVANAVNVLVALAIAAPSAPGFLGTFQIGCVAAISTIYGASNEFAVAYSIVMHSYQMILSILLGFLMLRYEGLRFAQLRARGEDPAPAL